jgi:alkylation response protein AidB-like acyl-CoA dehydrogenase
MDSAVTELERLRESISQVLAVECDSHSLHQFVDGNNGLGERIWACAGDLGWLAIGAPEAYGGMGLGIEGLCILNEELGRHLVPGPFMATLIAAQWLAEVGSERQKIAYLSKLVSGEISAAIPALSRRYDSNTPEFHAGAMPSTIKMLGSQQANLFVVPVVGSGGEPAYVLVEPAQAELAPFNTWDRTRSLFSLRSTLQPNCELIWDVKANATALLERIYSTVIAADSLGAADAVFNATVEYMKIRTQFDRPIGSFQALKHRTADMKSLLVSRQFLNEQAIQSSRSDNDWEADVWAALAKSEATSAAATIAADCVQLHGGVGFTWEFDIHLYLKRARLNESLVGPNEKLRDHAAECLTRSVQSGRSVTEIPL